MNNLTTEQLLFLDNIIYLNISYVLNKTGEDKSITISYLIEEFLDNIDTCASGDPALVTKEEWIDLLESFAYEKDENGNYKTDSNGNKVIKEENRYFLENYVVENYTTSDTDEDGMRAACFVNKNDTTDVVAVFRGTIGGVEWDDNVIMANGTSSDVLDQAAIYINSLPEEYGNNITVTGHSKGGNKAQYVTIVTDRIGKCVSFDGQGFSQDFIDFYADAIEEKKSQITSICAQYDYVNAMLIPIAGEIKYIGGELDFNYGLNHCPNKIFDENGTFSYDLSLFNSYVNFQLSYGKLSETTLANAA